MTDLVSAASSAVLDILHHVLSTQAPCRCTPLYIQTYIFYLRSAETETVIWKTDKISHVTQDLL